MSRAAVESLQLQLQSAESLIAAQKNKITDIESLAETQRIRLDQAAAQMEELVAEKLAKDQNLASLMHQVSTLRSPRAACEPNLIPQQTASVCKLTSNTSTQTSPMDSQLAESPVTSNLPQPSSHANSYSDPTLSPGVNRMFPLDSASIGAFKSKSDHVPDSPLFESTQSARRQVPESPLFYPVRSQVRSIPDSPLFSPALSNRFELPLLDDSTSKGDGASDCSQQHGATSPTSPTSETWAASNSRPTIYTPPAAKISETVHLSVPEARAFSPEAASSQWKNADTVAPGLKSNVTESPLFSSTTSFQNSMTVPTSADFHSNSNEDVSSPTPLTAPGLQNVGNQPSTHLRPRKNHGRLLQLIIKNIFSPLLSYRFIVFIHQFDLSCFHFINLHVFNPSTSILSHKISCLVSYYY